MRKKSNKRRSSLPNGDLNGQPAAMLLPKNPGEDFLTGIEWVTIGSALHLTARQIVVATLLLNGRTRKSIAHRLKVSPETVRVHIDALFDKFRVKDRLGLALRIARRREALQAAPDRTTTN